MDISESFLAHLAFILPSLFVRRPSVNISHFNLLLKNHWANCSQTLVEWSLDDPLPNVCGGSVGHNYERDPPKDHPCQVWFNLVQGFQRRKFKCESLFPIGSYVKLSSAVVAILVGCCY
jgi:hypothetical protein